MSLNGVWYDPVHAGCGFAFVANRFGSQVFFFGHGPDGEQLWFTGYGEPSAGISLTYSQGEGFPTREVDHEMVGHLKLGDVGDGFMDIEVELPVSLIGIGGVDVSPHPPRRKVVFHCIPIELSGKG